GWENEDWNFVRNPDGRKPGPAETSRAAMTLARANELSINQPTNQPMIPPTNRPSAFLGQCLRRRDAPAASDGNSTLYGNADSGASARKVTKSHYRALNYAANGSSREMSGPKGDG